MTGEGRRAERRRSRTYPPTGYAGSPVLKIVRKKLSCRDFLSVEGCRAALRLGVLAAARGKPLLR
jgi:hypothetical protein